MGGLRVIDNLEVDRLRREDALKRSKRGKGMLLGPQMVPRWSKQWWGGPAGGAVIGNKEAAEKICSKCRRFIKYHSPSAVSVCHHCGF